MMKWKKLGQIFNPFRIDTPSWMKEYGQLPFPIELNEDIIRIFFSTRPKKDNKGQYISYSAFIDVLKKDQTKIKNISKKPIIKLGKPGTFDEFGCMSSSFVSFNDEIRCYYTGWTRKHTVPYSMAIGLSISKDGGNTFKKYSKGPILGINKDEPYLVSGPIVKKINGNWNMWYLNGSKWLYDKIHKKYEPVYKIVHAKSNDGFKWKRNGISIIPSLTVNECQVSFALFKIKNLWNVIFAFRQPLDFRNNLNNSYKLGYAYSEDLISWKRKDSVLNFQTSKTGWDSEMIAYPQVGIFNDKIYLYYCGNNFGKEGFGYAELINN